MTCGMLAGVLSAGCSPTGGDGEATVMTVVTGFSQGGPASTVDTVNIGVPDSENLTGHSVRVERISLVSLPPSVHLRSVYAYAPGPDVGVMFGNLRTQCPAKKAYPLTAVVIPPHAVQGWHAIVAISFTKPGRYDLHHVKIYYVTDGHQGWQYQDLNTTMVISAPRKGARPAFDGCLTD